MPTVPVRIPFFALVVITTTYASLLFVSVTVTTGKWSEVAVLTYAYLVFIAPVIMSVIAYNAYRTWHSSTLHRFTFYAGASYCVIGLALLAFFTFFQF